MGMSTSTAIQETFALKCIRSLVKNLHVSLWKNDSQIGVHQRYFKLKLHQVFSCADGD